MTKNRLEAFSDGVIAIIITIMVLEMKFPATSDVQALKPQIPLFLSYILSFVHVGIYWNNHHHLLHLAEKVNGKVLWANLHLLFWLSLTPLVAAWMGNNYLAPWPVAFYGIILLMSALAYHILVQCLVQLQGQRSLLAKAIADDTKGRLSNLIYVIAIPLAFVETWLSFICFVSVSAMWLIPDRRIEKVLVE